MRYLIVPLFYALVNVLTCTAQQLDWLKSYGPLTEQDGTQEFGIIPGEDGSIFGTAAIGSGNWDFDGAGLSVGLGSDILVCKFNESGSVEWAHTLGGQCNVPNAWAEIPRFAVLDTNSNNFVLTASYSGIVPVGSTTLPGPCEYRNLMLVSYTQSGAVAWVNHASGGDIVAESLLLAPDGNFDLFGRIRNGPITFHGTPDEVIYASCAFHARYDGQGQLLSAENLLDTGEVFCASWLEQDLVLGGTVYGPDTLWGHALSQNASLSSGFLCRSNSLGAVLWSVECRSAVQSGIADCTILSNGDIAVTGYYKGMAIIEDDTLWAANSSQIERFIARFNASGALIWLKPVTSNSVVGIRSISADSNDGFFIQGNGTGTLHIGDNQIQTSLQNDQFIAHIDAVGNWVEALILPGSGRPSWLGMIESSGAITIAGAYDTTMVIGNESFSPTVGNWPNLFLAKFEGLGPVSSLQAINHEGNTLEIYANPNRGDFRLRLPDVLSNEHQIQLRIYDGLGNLIVERSLIIDADRPHLDIWDMTSGLYVVTLSNGKLTFSGNLIVE